jgi:hypothetical protein
VGSLQRAWARSLDRSRPLTDAQGDLGIGCNEGENETCGVVFVARATCFATLVLLLMVHAFTCKHVEKSYVAIVVCTWPA